MEAWRQWPLGRKKKTFVSEEERRIHLTPTGLLMEGDSAQIPPSGGEMSVIAIYQQSE
jgi:hypothetical protein